MDDQTLNLVNEKIKLFLNNEETFSIKKVSKLKKDVSSIVLNSGIDFFEIQTFEKKENKNKVNVLHNVLRPDWSNGNISENYNQAFINGIVNLNKPDTEILVTLQNDAVVHPNWCKNLDILFNKKGSINMISNKINELIDNNKRKVFRV